MVNRRSTSTTPEPILQLQRQLEDFRSSQPGRVFRSGKNIAINFSSTDDQHVSTMVLHLPNGEMQIPIVRE